MMRARNIDCPENKSFDMKASNVEYLENKSCLLCAIKIRSITGKVFEIWIKVTTLFLIITWFIKTKNKMFGI